MRTIPEIEADMVKAQKAHDKAVKERSEAEARKREASKEIGKLNAELLAVYKSLNGK